MARPASPPKQAGGDQSPPPWSAQQPPIHQSDAGDDDDNVKQLKECSSLYISLQDCLVNSNRNWKACQKEVQALKACNELRSKINRGN